MAKYRLTNDGLGVEEDRGDGFEPIARFTVPKDASEFKKLKEDRYTEVTNTWLGSEAFYQRFSTYIVTDKLPAGRMLDRLQKLI